MPISSVRMQPQDGLVGSVAIGLLQVLHDFVHVLRLRLHLGHDLLDLLEGFLEALEDDALLRGVGGAPGVAGGEGEDEEGEEEEGGDCRTHLACLNRESGGVVL